MWIYQSADWPAFTWNSAILSQKLADVRHRQGRLLGHMESLELNLQAEANLNTMTEEIVRSSAIEGERLNPEEVRSSIARRLGLESRDSTIARRKVEGIVEVIIDATRQYEQSLTKERLFAWHAALFPSGWSGLRKITVGNWRPETAGTMRVVSGSVEKEKVHFEAPTANSLEREMAAFLSWFENSTDTDPFIKAAIAHLWFITIHPFEDGNGRMARAILLRRGYAIAEMALTRADGIPTRFYSMSTQIERERTTYYAQLEQQQRSSTDITDWIDWFLYCLGRAIQSAETALAAILYKSEIWKVANSQNLNQRQRLILNRLLDGFNGPMDTSKYAKIAKCSTDTALRDIRSLVNQNLLIQNSGGGRSTSYRLPAPEELKQ